MKEEDILKQKGLKITKARLTILKVFSQKCEPLSAEKIASKISSKDKIDLVTIYRTLDIFEKKGIIHRLNMMADSVYFEISQKNHHHHHIICVKCGVIEPFEHCTIESYTKKVIKSSQIFKNITQHSLELFGVCRVCEK